MSQPLLPLRTNQPLGAVLASQACSSESSAWHETCWELWIPPDGRGLRDPTMQWMLRQWVDAIERTAPAQLDREHVDRLVARLRRGLAAAFNPPPNATPGAGLYRCEPHGVLTEHPCYGAVLSQVLAQHQWDPLLLVLAHLWWRSRVRRYVAGPEPYHEVKEWRYAGAARHVCSPAIQKQLKNAAALPAEQAGAELQRIAEQGLVSVQLSKHLSQLAHVLQNAPRYGRRGHGGPRGPAQYRELGREWQRTVARSGSSAVVATTPLGDDDPDAGNAPTLVRGAEELHRPSPTPARRRRAVKGLRAGLARQNLGLTGAGLTPAMTRGALGLLRARIEHSNAMAVVYYLGLALGVPWTAPRETPGKSSPFSVVVHTLSPDDDLAHHGPGPDEIAYCRTRGDVYIGRAYPPPGQRASAADAHNPTHWTLQLSGQPARLVIDALTAASVGGRRLDKDVDLKAVTEQLTEPIELVDGTTLDRSIVRSLGTALYQFAARRRVYHTAVLDAVFARPHDASMSHYVRMDSASLSAAYQSTWGEFAAEMHWCEPALPLQPRRVAVPIGSGRGPSREELRGVVTTLQQCIHEEANAVHTRTAEGRYTASRERLVADATLYVWIQVGLTCAARGVRSPGPTDQASSDHDALALVADKAAHGQLEARITGLPPSVRDSRRALRALLTERALELGLAPPGTDSDGRFWTIDAGAWTPVSPSWLDTALASLEVQWPANALRHYTATWAANHAVPEVAARHWLGHWREGQAPVGGASLLSMRQIAAVIEHHAGRLLADVGADRPLAAFLR